MEKENERSNISVNFASIFLNWKLLWGLLICVGSFCYIGQYVPVAAQSSPTSRSVEALPSADWKLQLQPSVDDFIRGAIAVSQAVASGGAAGLYDGASTVMKSAQSRDEFVAGAREASRATLPVNSRIWQQVHRISMAAPSDLISKGEYISVVLVCANGDRAVRTENISFRYEEDGGWKLVGFRFSLSE